MGVGGMGKWVTGVVPVVRVHQGGGRPMKKWIPRILGAIATFPLLWGISYVIGSLIGFVVNLWVNHVR